MKKTHKRIEVNLDPGDGDASFFAYLTSHKRDVSVEEGTSSKIPNVDRNDWESKLLSVKLAMANPGSVGL